MQGPRDVGVIGGGGCPGSTEVMLPDLPFDYLQPPMVHGITQVGYGGPFVIRSNPLGAVLDTIRGFCAPVPMQVASPDGNFGLPDNTSGFTDLSGLGQDIGAAGGFTGFPSVTCPPDMPLYNSSTGMCQATQANTPVPSTGGGAAFTSQCTDPMYFDSVMNSYIQAFNTGDICGMCEALGQVQACGTTINPGGSWIDLYGKIYSNVVLALPPGATCVSVLKKGCGMNSGTTGGSNAGTSAGRLLPPGIGSILPMAPFPNVPLNQGRPSSVLPSTANTRGNPVSGAMMGNTGGMGATNVVTIEGYSLPPLPRMPQMTDLTEGNTAMTPAPEPFGGSFAPEASLPRRVMRTPMQILKGVFSGRRGA